MTTTLSLAAAAALGLLAFSFVRYGSSANPTTRGTSSGDKPYVTLAGAKSRIEEPAVVRVTTAKEFQDLYLRHLGEDSATFDEFFNPHGVPEIDFERCMVLAVFKGEVLNMAGVYVESVADEGARTIVRIDGRSFQTAGPDGGAVRATPYGILVLPRTDREVVVEEDVNHLKNAPPKWKELARFPARKR